jgi:hypothetical protein
LEIIASGLQTNTYYAVMARTNGPRGHWTSLTGILNDKDPSASVIYNLGEIRFADLKGLSLGSLSNWTFVVGPGGDEDGDGLPDVYEELATRTDPYSNDDGYGDADADGWPNIAEMQNGTDPITPDVPAGPSNVSVQRNINGITKVSWSSWHLPDYFLVEKTDRTLKRITNTTPIPPPSSLNSSNMNEYSQRRREFQQQGGRFNRPRQPEYETSPPRIVAKIIPNPGQHDFNYTETNAPADLFSSPVYRVKAHFTPPLSVFLDVVNAAAIRQTVVSVEARPSTNGYGLTVLQPVPYAHYLLLVRDKRDLQWKTSGYFCSNTNRDPIHLHVDRKGMMEEGQCSIAMPQVQFVPDVITPEFIAGWGEDSDGDGLPDIYEVLVTQTDPTKPDTGDTGLLDGYKDTDSDGVNTLEEFRRRTNPLQPNAAPAPVELKRPTLAELWGALARERLKTDIQFRPEISLRKPGETDFRPIDPGTFIMDYRSNLRDPKGTKLDFDVRIYWHTPKPPPIETGYYGP